jgi:hypothetical protein
MARPNLDGYLADCQRWERKDAPKWKKETVVPFGIAPHDADFFASYAMLSPPALRAWLRLFPLLLLAPALSSPAAEPLPAIDGRWKHIRSPNFELYTHDSEELSRTLLHDLELLRALFLDRFKGRERAKLDLTVYLFRRDADFRAYAPETMANPNLRGFYHASPDRAIVSLAPMGDWESSQRIVFHEYVHHLFRITEQRPPAWFNEGWAEVLSAIRVEDGRLEIGQPHLSRVETLQTEKLLPLETLFTIDHRSPLYRAKQHAGLFYAQSWALLHYWHFGDSRLPKDSVLRFTTVAGDPRVAPDIDLRAFFRQCFGMDYPEMVKRLESYVRDGSYRVTKIPVPDVAKATTYAARPVPRDELQLRLAELALRTTQSAMGKFLLVDAAGKPNPEARILEALGADALRNQDEPKARERWEEAVAAGSTNATVLRELGLIESRQWFNTFSYDFRLPAETAERLRARLKRSIELEPEQSGAYEMLAWVEAYAETPVVGNVLMVQNVFPRLNERQRTLLALVMARVRSGLKDQAMSMLGKFEQLPFDEWSARAAEVVRAKLENRPARPITRPASARELAATAEDNPRFLRWPSVEIPVSP